MHLRIQSLWTYSGTSQYTLWSTYGRHTIPVKTFTALALERSPAFSNKATRQRVPATTAVCAPPQSTCSAFKPFSFEHSLGTSSLKQAGPCPSLPKSPFPQQASTLLIRSCERRCSTPGRSDRSLTLNSAGQAFRDQARQKLDCRTEQGLPAGCLGVPCTLSE